MNIKTIKILIAILTISFLSACHKNDQQKAPEPGQPSQPASDNPIQKSGPSDGGGGDTCNGKMIESYKVDVTTLPEFQEHIFPILKKLSPEDKNKDAGSPFLLSAHLKNWYIIDCKLNDIPQERKGLYLETYQTAIHTSREIFIDSKSYAKMEKVEKAKLLLHEMIMSYYLMKYLTFEEICKIIGTCEGDFAIASKWKMFKPEPYRPLNQEDHQKIRNVTSWLWAQKDAVTPESFTKMLKNNDFDRRFGKVTGPGEEVENKEIEIDWKVILRVLKRHNFSRSFPKFCQFSVDTLVSAATCETELIAEERDLVVGLAKMKQLYVKIKITRSTDKKVFESEFTFPLSGDSRKIKMSISRMGSVLKAASFAMFGNWPTLTLQKPEEGMQSQVLFFMFDLNNLEDPSIYQIIYQTYVWHSFEDVVTQKDGHTTTEKYGYTTLIREQSETLFIENELLFELSSFFSGKSLISSTSVYNAK